MTNATAPQRPASCIPDFPWDYCVLVLVVAGLTGLGLWINCERQASIKPKSAVAVVATRRIPAYTRLTAEDMTVSKTDGADSAHVELGKMIGKLTSGVVEPMVALTEASLIELPSPLPSGSVTLVVPATSVEQVVVGEKIDLVGVPAEATAPSTVVIAGAIVIAVNESDVAVAAPPDDATKASFFLGEKRRLVILRHVDD